MKLWHMDTVEFYLDVQENEVMKLEEKWMGLENITPSEVIHSLSCGS